MKGLLLALGLLLGTTSYEANACGLHTCDVSINVGFVGAGSRPFFYGAPPVYGQVGGFYGPGARAFRRSFRLRNRAVRAAMNGNFGRAARLSYRSQAAFARGVNRGGGFFVRPYWM